jgi:O-antigen/teichoic acid export membrane protein
MRSLTHTYAAMLFARGLAILGSLGVAILTARILGPADRGRYYYVVTLALVGVQFASLGIHSSNTYLIARTPTLLAQIMANTVWIATLGGITAAGGVLVFDLFTGDSAQTVVLIVTVLTLSPSLLLFLYLSNIAVALNRPQAFNGLIILNSAASIAMALFAAHSSPTLNGFLFAAVAASLISCSLAWVVLANGISIPRTFDHSLFCRGIGFALRAHIATLFGFLMIRLNVVVLRQFGTFADLGHWSIAAQIADALMVLPATIGLLLFPSLVRAEGAMRWNAYKVALFQLSLMMAVLCVVSAALARFIIDAIFGSAYSSAVEIIFALLPGVFFLGVASVASQLLSANGFPWSQVLAWVSGALLQAVLSVTLFGAFGTVGLAWIQSACAAFVCVWLLLDSLKFKAV